MRRYGLRYPPLQKTGDNFTVGWVWLINLTKGDRVEVKIICPVGEPAINV